MNHQAKTKDLPTTIREYVATLVERRRDLAGRRAEIDAEIESLYTAPLSRADALAFVYDYIDRLAAEFPTSDGGLADALDATAYPHRYPWPNSRRPGIDRPEPINLRDIDTVLNGTPADRANVFDGGLAFFNLSAQSHTQRISGLYFFFGDQIKAKIAQHFDALYPRLHAIDAERVGPPVVERRRRLAELAEHRAGIDAELAKVDAELAAIRSTAQPAAQMACDRAAGGHYASPSDIETDRAIYRDFNGRNEEEVARRHRVPVARVKAVGGRIVPP